MCSSDLDAQRHVAADIRRDVKRRQRHLHVVPDASNVDDNPAGVFFDQSTAKEGDHGRYWRQERSVEGGRSARKRSATAPVEV